MKNNFVIFKSPYLRYRKEKFGGIAKLNLKTFIINKLQYDLIERIKKVLVYGELTQREQKVADKLIENKLLLKVDLERAKELGFKK
jgi:hypothetical protein